MKGLLTIFLTMCFLITSWTSGTKKICVYDCIDGQTSITVSILDACPVFLSN